MTLILACSVLWRIGGAKGFSKLYRRIGSTLCLTAIVGQLWAILPIFWGCSSYFGWMNRFLPVKDKDREYWWNFWLQNFVIQSSVFFVNRGFDNIMLVVFGSLFISLVKVWIDEEWKPKWRPRQDIVSELWHGFGNAALLSINILI